MRMGNSLIKKGILVGKITENREDFIDLIVEETGLSKVDSTKLFDKFVDSIVQTLRAGKSVAIPKFGVFSVKARAARVGRNPKTGEALQIKAANVAAFKAGKALKDAVNSGSVVAE